MKFFKKKKKEKEISFEQAQTDKDNHTDLLLTDLNENIENIKLLVGNSSDIVIREFQIDIPQSIKACIFYTDGLVDTNSIQNFIMESLLSSDHAEKAPTFTSKHDVLSFLKERV